MPAMISEIYDAFREAGTSEEKARKAAEAMASFEHRFAQVERSFERIEGRLNLLNWMIAFNLALTVAIVLRLFLR